MAEREEELKSHLMKVKEESEKVGLKVNIQKTEIMASFPSLGNLPTPGIELRSPALQKDALPSEPPGKSPGPVTSQQIDGETVETARDFIFGSSKITADGDCSHEIKRHLLLGRKVMTNLDSILKSRDITLLTKVHLVKAMVFPLVMYGCESWTIKKAERQRIDAFEL